MPHRIGAATNGCDWNQLSVVWRLNNKLRQQTWCRRWRYLLTRCSAVSSSSQQRLRRNACTVELKDKTNLWTYICHLRHSRKIIISVTRDISLTHTHTYGAGNTAHVGTVELLPPRLLRLLFLRRRLEKSGVMQCRHWLVRRVANIKPARLLADFHKIKGRRMKSACVLSWVAFLPLICTRISNHRCYFFSFSFCSSWKEHFKIKQSSANRSTGISQIALI